MVWRLAIMVAIMSWLVGKAASRPVGYERFSRFARQARMNADVGQLEVVRRYLEVTRRWRVIGVGAAICFTLAEGLRRNAIHLDLYIVLSGWFAGAVFAEWRLNTPPLGEKRRASLMSRRQASYLSPAHRTIPWMAALVALTVGGLNIAEGLAITQNVVLMGWVVAVMSAIVAASRQVLVRPQPFDADPLHHQADDALRARSLSVLSGSATALMLTSLAALIVLSTRWGSGSWEAVPVVLALLAPVIGWLMATNTRPRRVVAEAVAQP